MKQDEIQQEIVEKALKFFETDNKGYIDGAMRLGKIKITIDVLEILCRPISTILICYPDNNIKQSWIDEFKKWGYNSFNIVFTNFSSLSKFKDARPDFFIIDEFHSCSFLERDYCHQIMTNYVNTKTLGLSGTISEETKGDWGLKEIAKYTTLDGIKDGILSDYVITVHKVALDTKAKTPNKKGKLLSEKQKYDNLSFVIRRKLMEGDDSMFLALARNRLSLSSIGKMEYLRKLLLKLKDKRVIVFTGLSKVADDIGIPSYHSKSKTDLDYRMFFDKKYDQLALAAMGKSGVTYPDLDSVILLNFTYNAEETSQILNRAIKLDYKGKVADLHIICLNEPPELKKIKESLSMLDKNKITYL
jgi:superfamily II DNA or RNA helicase